MVIISNNPIDAESFVKQYPSDSIEAIIFNQLYSSDKDFNYDSLEQLEFELNMRKEIIKSSIDLYNSHFGFAVFRKSKCNEKYWKRTDEGGFLLRDDVKPSDAIRDIFTNSSKYATECATAMVIIYYKALLDIYPEELFNELFSEIQLMNWHYLDPLLKEVGRTRPSIGILKADQIIDALNKNRKPNAQRSAYLLDSAGRPNFKNLFDVYRKSAT